MDIESQSLTTCEVAPNGNTVVLGFTDSRGAPARIRLPLNQLGALAVTLPDLINKALQSRYGDHTLRYACPRASFGPIVQDARRIISSTDALRTRAKNVASVAEPKISLDRAGVSEHGADRKPAHLPGTFPACLGEFVH